ncbi:MAG: GNAT family N-acetyltransferase [Acidiferrobacterales bacterium]
MRDKIYAGRYVTLKPVNADKDADELYQDSHGSEEIIKLWTYMHFGPFGSQDTMLEWLKVCQDSSDPLFLTVYSRDAGRRVGMTSFTNIVPAMRRLELGNIWYSPKAQRNKINTETIYLMLCEAFDALRYRRVEWKCDSLNARSRAAARRLGFSFEGIFKQHMIIKGRNRDTSWYAMLDSDWPVIRTNMEQWLYSDNEPTSLAELNRSVLRSQSEDS